MERGRVLLRMAARIRERADELARLETRNNGMPLSDARKDVETVATAFEYYAGAANKVFGHTIPVAGDFLDYTLREPVGVVAAIIPWNSPLIMAQRKVAPALAAGCTLVLKPASYTPLTALVLGDIATESGLPPGVLNIITGLGEVVGDALVRHPGVNKVGFTGETANGKAIMRKAADGLKRISLELGGKGAGIIFADAELERAVDACLFGAFGNCGQRCNARSRLYVQRAIYDRFVEQLVAGVRALRVGDPLADDTHIGPLISRRQLEKVREYVDGAVQDGATLVVGGATSADPALTAGNYYLPTVLIDTRNTMRVVREEIFGPVVTVQAFDTEDEVIALANDSVYGLAASLFTTDLRRAHQLARRLESGNVSVNTFAVNPLEAPYGGYKQSGIGRELGLAALDLYTEIKNVNINLGDGGCRYFQ
jgi:aldehyde dehydrogenase (NAD+)/betaine-aldehyde dehydrogenase